MLGNSKTSTLLAMRSIASDSADAAVMSRTFVT